jgi:lipopolysaccharide transport system ATP-binding protein
MSTAIKVENLSKIYRLGEIGTGTISKDIQRWFTTSILGKEDPYLKIGQTNDRTLKGVNDIVYSLQDINFEIKQGDAVGIIGRNGAGKSTLLKILSRVTSPTTGKINVKGRVASLLEVGTGFHPELTGRENIYLNGAILGMRKHEITRKLDEIIAFSGVERYIDTPVKRYSSGMYVRLAFAVAAHLESEILIVDEVLAVGDAEFQKKCLGKMGEVSKGEGRTVLFVSHNMAAVKELCSSGILLANGKLADVNSAEKVVNKYLDQNITININDTKVINNSNIRRGNGEIRITEVKGIDAVCDYGKDIHIDFELTSFGDVKECEFSMVLRSEIGNQMLSNIPRTKITLEDKKLKFSIKISAKQIRPGIYPLYLWVGRDIMTPYDVIDNIFTLRIQTELGQTELGFNPIENGGFFNLNYNLQLHA